MRAALVEADRSARNMADASDATAGSAADALRGGRLTLAVVLLHRLVAATGPCRASGTHGVVLAASLADAFGVGVHGGEGELTSVDETSADPALDE